MAQRAPPLTPPPPSSRPSTTLSTFLRTDTSSMMLSTTSAPRMAGRPTPSGRPASLQARGQPSRAVTTCALKSHPKAAGAAAAAAAALLGALPASASDIVQAISDTPNASLAVGGGAAIAALSAALVAADPEKRRQEQMKETSGDELAAVKNYFNTEGFSRWNKIYGETDEVNKVQLDIRTGHAVTVEKVLGWFEEEGGVEGMTIADAGCGTGSLAIPLALKGATVSASDISSAMAGEAAKRYEAAAQKAGSKPAVAPTFEALDLESVTGKYDTVTCLDVMIHYPQDKADNMVKHLASLSERRLVRIGEFFPGPSKATRAYLHAEADVERSLNEAGFKVVKREMTATQFYFSRLLEAVRE
eukprot:jgi/Tetstr1/446093/TSEL_033693.t1